MMCNILMFFVFAWFMDCTQSRDVCNRNAILKRSEEVYLSQEIKANFVLDLTDLITTLDNILKSKEPFIKEISKYSTMDKLRAIETKKLIPFNNRVNLIQVSGTSVEVIEKCAVMKTSVFSFDTVDEIGLMTETMKEKNIQTIAFVPFMSLTELLGRESQRFLWLRPANYNSQYFANNYLGLYNVNGNLELISSVNDTVNSFCSKPAHPYESLDFDQFESRTWLQLVDRSMNNLKIFEKLYLDLKDKFQNVKINTNPVNSEENVNRVTWVVPSEMLRAVEFVTGHDTTRTWEVADGDTLQDLSQFCLDMNVITEYMSEQIIFSNDRLTIYPRFEKEGPNGMIMKEMIFYSRSKVNADDVSGKTILHGEAIGKSATDLTKVIIYRGYAYGYDNHRPVDSIVVSDHGTYRAVPQFEDLKWECTNVKSKKICSDQQRGMDERETTCGDYFFGRTDDYHKCHLTEVKGPIVIPSVCGSESEVMSSHYQPYKLSLWCNGQPSDTMELPAGVSTIATKCEVRSDDGRTTYAYQTGMKVEKGATYTRLSSTNKNAVLRAIEDTLGWPVTGTLLGIGTITIFGFCICLIKCIGCSRCLRMFGRRPRIQVPPSVIKGVNPVSVARRVAEINSLTSRTTDNVPSTVTVYNFAPDGRRTMQERLALV